MFGGGNHDKNHCITHNNNSICEIDKTKYRCMDKANVTNDSHHIYECKNVKNYNEEININECEPLVGVTQIEATVCIKGYDVIHKTTWEQMSCFIDSALYSLLGHNNKFILSNIIYRNIDELDHLYKPSGSLHPDFNQEVARFQKMKYTLDKQRSDIALLNTKYNAEIMNDTLLKKSQYTGNIISDGLRKIDDNLNQDIINRVTKFSEYKKELQILINRFNNNTQVGELEKKRIVELVTELKTLPKYDNFKQSYKRDLNNLQTQLKNLFIGIHYGPNKPNQSCIDIWKLLKQMKYLDKTYVGSMGDPSEVIGAIIEIFGVNDGLNYNGTNDKLSAGELLISNTIIPGSVPLTKTFDENIKYINYENMRFSVTRKQDFSAIIKIDETIDVEYYDDLDQYIKSDGVIDIGKIKQNDNIIKKIIKKPTEIKRTLYLTSVTINTGGNHYICYIRRNDEWYQFDDMGSPKYKHIGDFTELKKYDNNKITTHSIELLYSMYR
jgi:hypothetical protein